MILRDTKPSSCLALKKGVFEDVGDGSSFDLTIEYVEGIIGYFIYVGLSQKNADRLIVLYFIEIYDSIRCRWLALAILYLPSPLLVMPAFSGVLLKEVVEGG